MIDYYKVLNVSHDVSPEALKEQYRFLLNAFHPDKFSAAGQEKSLAKAEEKTKEINAAYEVLRSPASRAEYDRKRAAEKERLRASSAPPPETPQPRRSPPDPPAHPAAEPTGPRPGTENINDPPVDEELIRYCLEIMRETGQASTALFQRRFRFGYTRAARLMAVLESRGIVGPYQGHGEREILVDLGQRPHTPAHPPGAVAAPMPDKRSSEDEVRRLQAEQQRLEAQLRLQRIASARPVVRRGGRPLIHFGCLQGCVCLVIAVVGFIFLLGLSRSCTRPSGAPSAVSVQPSATQPFSDAPLNSEQTGPPPVVRRALPIDSASQPTDPANAVPPGFYSVTGIDRNDALNVHIGPGSNYQVIARLPNGSRGVQVVGTSVMNGTTEWVQINYRNQAGWVTKAYLKAQ